MKFLPQLILATSLTFSVFLSSAAFSAETDSNKNGGIQGVVMLKAALNKLMPSIKPTQISKSPVEGMYEVIIGSQVVYMSVDARYMIEGDLFDFKTKTNVTENAKSTVRLSLMKLLDEKDMLVYKPDKVSKTITVVTDIDCPYCRKLHREIPEYLENDIEVRYIFMPLKGFEDMKKTVSVWCADNQQEALDTAKAGLELEDKTCDNPIKDHLKLARALGVNGTPAILLEDGRLLPGYVPVKKLVADFLK